MKNEDRNLRTEFDIPKACADCSRPQTYGVSCSNYGGFGCGLYLEQHPETKFPGVKKAKHTPGPWTITNLNGSKHITFTPVYAGREVKVEIAKVTGLKNYDNSALLAAAPELLAALEMQEAAFSALSMAHHYRDSMEGAKDHGQKQYAKNAYLEAAKEADILQDKASEMRRAAIAKAKGE